MTNCTKRLFTKEDIFKFEFITEAALSPDESKIIYTQSWVDAEQEKEFQSLWLHDLQSGETKRLTSGDKKDYSFSWSPDGERIAFLSTRKGAPQIYVLSLAGGEARQLSELEQGVGTKAVWSPDGKMLAFTAGPSADDRPDMNNPYRITRNIYRFDGMGYLDQTVQDVYVISAEGGEAKRLTSNGWMHISPKWSPDGQKLLCVTGFRPDSSEFYFDLKTVALDGVEQSVLSEWGMVAVAEWLPDGESIAFCGVSNDSPSGYKTDLFTISSGGGDPECRTESLAAGLGGFLSSDMPLRPAQAIRVSSDGKQAYFSVQDKGEVKIYRAALKGKEHSVELVSGARLNALMDAGEKHLLYLVSDFKDPINLHLNDLSGKAEKQITDINRALLDELCLPEVKHVQYESFDEQEIDGWLMMPPNAEPPYPTVLYVHGGPHGAYGNAFSLDFQMLAGAGFAVLSTNPRGSSGYGSDFASVIVGQLGHYDFKDVMAGIDHVIEEDLADENRLGICGLSYGGQMTTWAVGNTDRFKAAVSENPVVDRRAYFGISDMAAWWVVKLLGGKPWDIPEVYRRCSPITYAHNASTPTLLIQGESDFRCTKEQSEMFYTALKVAGCVTEMVRLPNSFHAGSINGAPVVRRVQNEELLGWMEKYI